MQTARTCQSVYALIILSGADGYGQVIDVAVRDYGFDGSLKKHSLMIGTRLAMAHEAGARLPVLDRLCDAIIGM